MSSNEANMITLDAALQEASIHYQAGRLQDAERFLQAILQTQPQHAAANYNMGLLATEVYKYDIALFYFKAALQANPQVPQFWVSYVGALIGNDQLQLATSVPDQCLQHGLIQEAAHCYNRLGNHFYLHGQLEKAAHNFSQAVKLDSDFVLAYSNLLFCLSHDPYKFTRADLLKEHLRFADRFENPLKAFWEPHANLCNSTKRLRVGYVSADFRSHAVATFIEPILARHDKSGFEIHCYYNQARSDEITSHIQSLADHWVPCHAWSDDQLAERIRADSIDILIDLSGHTAGNRLPVFARKPAPVQITYLGYPGTTGLSAIDYRITDAYADPVGSDQYYSEKLLRLPDSLCCYQPLPNMPDVSPLPALANGYVTFGSFNNSNKIDQQAIALWAQILRALPSSRLLMLPVPEGERKEQIASQFEREGVSRERIDFYGSMPSHDFHAMLGKADIALDPLLVTGGTTTCETLWMGVPVVVLKGQRFIHRVGYSFLCSAELSEYAADTPEDYVRVALKAAAHLPELAKLRTGLREQLATSPLMDRDRFVRNFEHTLRQTWEEWCKSADQLTQ